MKWWFKQPLYIQIIICIILGIGLGLILGPRSVILKPAGDTFIRLLKMLIVPLTFFTLSSSLLKMKDFKSLRSVGGMILFYYTLSSLLATTVGMIVALIIRPGEKVLGLLGQESTIPAAKFNFIENMVNWIPDNPIQAMAAPNMLQVIVFSLIVGVTILSLGKKVETISRFILQGADLMIRMTELIMKLAPYGILALIADMVGSFSTALLSEVGRFILADTVSVLFIIIVIYPILLQFWGRLNPFRFFRNIASAMLVAASTTSSSATLPVSMRVARKNLGVPESIYGFTLPLGMTINMDGMAASLGVIAVFSANLYGVSITPGIMLQFVFLGLVLSIGTAGIKNSGVVMSSVLLQTLNMPLTLIPILAAVWPIIDIGHTTANVTGDLNGTTIVSARLRQLNNDIFYNRHVTQ